MLALAKISIFSRDNQEMLPLEEFATTDNQQTSFSEDSGTHIQCLWWLALVYVSCMPTPLSSCTITAPLSQARNISHAPVRVQWELLLEAILKINIFSVQEILHVWNHIWRKCWPVKFFGTASLLCYFLKYIAIYNIMLCNNKKVYYF